MKAGYSRVTHPSAAFHLHLHPEGICRRLLARLACVRHAASVRPEPGSNSRLCCYISDLSLLHTRSFVSSYSNTNVFVKFAIKLFRIDKVFVSCFLPCAFVVILFRITAFSLFTFQTSSRPLLGDFVSISLLSSLVNTFFQFFLKNFVHYHILCFVIF